MLCLYQYLKAIIFKRRVILVLLDLSFTFFKNLDKQGNISA